ncbi:MAG: hypothetical protein ACO1SX_00460 [Actinomycetota bacterium]
MIRLVHGTHSGHEFSRATSIRAIGEGEYGLGFYTFLANLEGMKRATEWAELRCPRGAAPMLVFVDVDAAVFAYLEKVQVTAELVSHYTRMLMRRGITGKHVVFGPVTRISMEGAGRAPKWQPHPHLPWQYKFESGAVHYLKVSRVEVLER